MLWTIQGYSWQNCFCDGDNALEAFGKVKPQCQRNPKASRMDDFETVLSEKMKLLNRSRNNIAGLLMFANV